MSIVPITEQIDQSNFVKTEFDNVFFDTEKEQYFFCDETTEAHGPCNSLQEAKALLTAYVESLG